MDIFCGTGIEGGLFYFLNFFIYPLFHLFRLIELV